MEIYFSEEESEQTDCRDEEQRYVGGIQIPPEVWSQLQTIDLDWDKLPNESSEYGLYVGNVVGVHLEEIGYQPHPYIVSEVDEEPDKEKYNRMVVLKNSSYDDIQTVVITCGRSGTRADYKHEETSRYVAGDGITTSLLPDLLLADILEADELRAHMLSSIV